MAVRDSYLFLLQEGHLFRSCLTHGLTALRNSTMGAKGLYYTAFFQLSIGFERLMKAIFILDHMAKNGLATPTGKQLRDHSHDLISLLASLKSMSVSGADHSLDAIAQSSVTYEILHFLSEFAKHARYYNLDSLTLSQSGSDPLANWHVIVARILREDVPDKRKQRIDQTAQAIASAISGSTSVVAYGLDKQELDMQQYLSLPRLQETAGSYAVFHVFEWFVPLKNLLASARPKLGLSREVAKEI